MTKKGFLIAAFGVAAASSVSPLAAGLLGGAAFLNLCVGSLLKAVIKHSPHDKDYPVTSSRRLTEGEKALVKSIFGRKISTRGIKLYFSSEYRENDVGDTPASTIGKGIKFYGPDNHEEDYSRTDDNVNYNTFIHEMTHVLQHKHPLRLLLRNLIFGRDYDYELKESRFPQIISSFNFLGSEQQASAVADYAESFFYYRSEVIEGSDDELLANMVERKFPKARKTRLKLEKQEALEAQKKAPQKPSAPSPA